MNLKKERLIKEVKSSPDETIKSIAQRLKIHPETVSKYRHWSYEQLYSLGDNTHKTRIKKYKLSDEFFNIDKEYKQWEILRA